MTYPLTADGHEDLPRTLRREKEAREREAREREAAERAAAQREALPMGGPAGQSAAMSLEAAGPHPQAYAVPDAGYASLADAPMPARVTRFDVPFLHLVAFFLKAVLAAIPAILLLAALLWGLGQALQVYFPWLVKAQILIHFPNG